MQSASRQSSVLVVAAVIALMVACGDEGSPTAPSPVDGGSAPEGGGATSVSPGSASSRNSGADGGRPTLSASSGPSVSVPAVAAVRDLAAVAVYSLSTSRKDTVEVTWKPPLTGGSVDGRVTSYAVSHNGGAAFSMLASRCTGSWPATACSTSYTRLADGTHTFSVVPETMSTSGASSTASITLTATVPGAIRDLAGAQPDRTNHALLTWKTPLLSGTQTLDPSVTSYELRMEGYSYSTEQAAVACTAGACSATRDGHSYATFTYEVRAVNSAGPGPYGAVEVPITEAVHTGSAQPELAAVFGAPSLAKHGGKRFTIKLTFSEPVRVRSYRVVRDDALTVSGGRVTRAQRRPRGQNAAWRLTVEPADAAKEVTVTVPETTGCASTGALCTADGRMLSSSVSVIVPAS